MSPSSSPPTLAPRPHGDEKALFQTKIRGLRTHDGGSQSNWMVHPHGANAEIKLLQNERTKDFRALLLSTTPQGEVLSNHLIHPDTVLHTPPARPDTRMFWTQEWFSLKTDQSGGKLPREMCIEIDFPNTGTAAGFDATYKVCQREMAELHKPTKATWSRVANNNTAATITSPPKPSVTVPNIVPSRPAVSGVTSTPPDSTVGISSTKTQADEEEEEEEEEENDDEYYDEDEEEEEEDGDTVPDDDEEEEDELVVQTPGVPLKSLWARLSQGPTEGEWKCQTCSVRNKPSDTTCISCETPRPPSVDAVARVPEKTPMWKCPSCTTVNAIGKSQCTVCETDRPEGLGTAAEKPVSFNFSSITPSTSGADKPAFNFAPVASTSTSTTPAFNFAPAAVPVSASNKTGFNFAPASTTTNGKDKPSITFPTTTLKPPSTNGTSSLPSNIFAGFAKAAEKPTNDSSAPPPAFSFTMSNSPPKLDFGQSSATFRGFGNVPIPSLSSSSGASISTSSDAPAPPAPAPETPLFNFAATSPNIKPFVFKQPDSPVKLSLSTTTTTPAAVTSSQPIPAPPPATTTTTTTPSTTQLLTPLERVTRFYTKFNPTKLAEIPGLMEKYSGKETILYEKLMQKYKVTLSSADMFEGAVVNGNTPAVTITTPPASTTKNTTFSLYSGGGSALAATGGMNSLANIKFGATSSFSQPSVTTTATSPPGATPSQGNPMNRTLTASEQAAFSSVSPGGGFAAHAATGQSFNALATSRTGQWLS